MKKSKVLLAALAVVMVLTVSIGSAAAYFYAADSDTGTVALVPLTPTTTIEEPVVENGQKQVIIHNTGAAEVFVRARAYAPDDCVWSNDCGGTDWEKDGDWYYYRKVLTSVGTDGANSSALRLVWQPRVVSDETEAYNVVVVYEAIPATYDADGNAVADWSNVSLIIQGTSGQSGTEGGN